MQPVEGFLDCLAQVENHPAGAAGGMTTRKRWGLVASGQPSGGRGPREEFGPGDGFEFMPEPGGDAEVVVAEGETAEGADPSTDNDRGIE